MLDFVIILLFILAAAGIGFDAVELLPHSAQAQVSNVEALRWVTAGFGAIIGFAVGLMAQVTYRRFQAQVRKMPIEVLLTRAVGLVLGLLIANLMLAPIFLIPLPLDFGFIKPLAGILGSVMFAFLGVSLADTHGRALLRLINPNSIESILVAEGTLKPSSSKVLDTSCIIDGRIEELLNTGFVEGQILVSQFVLQELQQLADAANDQKRVRGRRGLEILNRMQQAYPDRLVIHPADYEDVNTVDAKLVRFAQDINGILVTNDYNLSKVANLQKVPVLNVNDLAQAVRPIYLPGDSIELKILKEGKEPSQGVGYLNDGTMVVVEEGLNHLGGELRVVVTSALQTSAGRMIFARPQASVAA
ncbi:PIN/TRAM domain-containing protein [Allocoleopsis franciscana]|uniref:Integral membrane protein (PIN domain superfamily) n=1 Tax=Allocoleopsis franciscana PCC 7113 TaxID=1173027 RepID=K9WKQ2_9CYAN|nr:PIN/TRAM domain-containing protein [Allocoleopsis franciscana]AFZ20990.1 integral membrane protein (PIN domain superfamily) [Allocoleopsis franciscana PCC 7113]